MAKTKLKIQNKRTKETSISCQLHTGSIPVPGPHTGTKIKQFNQGNPSMNQQKLQTIKRSKSRSPVTT